MSSRQQETKCLGFLCNQVIHSFIFCTYLDEHYAFDGVLFASDRDKDVKLYRVSAAALIEIFFGSYSVICWYGPIPIAPRIMAVDVAFCPKASSARRQPR